MFSIKKLVALTVILAAHHILYAQTAESLIKADWSNGLQA
jgi:hypothetical protein